MLVSKIHPQITQITQIKNKTGIAGRDAGRPSAGPANASESAQFASSANS
jgi:hypothetical protein